MSMSPLLWIIVRRFLYSFEFWNLRWGSHIKFFNFPPLWSFPQNGSTSSKHIWIDCENLDLRCYNSFSLFYSIIFSFCTSKDIIFKIQIFLFKCDVFYKRDFSKTGKDITWKSVHFFSFSCKGRFRLLYSLFFQLNKLTQLRPYRFSPSYVIHLNRLIGYSGVNRV